ncbi:TraH protein [Rhizobium sullae]|uniref:TraH protein n=1 Tax=Rhizobium sullae TaxID=50338 RepID=A0A4R3PSL5_RHISU|nr:TraH protein [Rhizobium sullae]
MIDAALIRECADPSLKPAIVEEFVMAAGSDHPFAVTVKSGGRLILVPKAASARRRWRGDVTLFDQGRNKALV